MNDIQLLQLFSRTYNLALNCSQQPISEFVEDLM